jgi:hypothetical protein
MFGVCLDVETAVTWVNVPSASSAVMIGGRMLFLPSAYFGGVAVPMAWHLALTEDGPLLLQLKEAQDSVLAAYADPSEYQHQGERMASGQRITPAATGGFLGWTKGIATYGNGRVRAVMELSGANPQPRLTGPLLPRARTAGPGPAGPCGACLPVGCPM